MFVDELFPAIRQTDEGRRGRINLEVAFYGPGDQPCWTDLRTILRGRGYKNWRLNGRYILRPEENPTRFDALQENDFAVFEFEGDLLPTSAKLVLVSQNDSFDHRLYQGLQDFGVGSTDSRNSMVAMSLANLESVVSLSGTPESHSIYELLLDHTIIEAAQFNPDATDKLLRRTNRRPLSRAALQRANERNDQIGFEGEELVNAWLDEQRQAGLIEDFAWVADSDAIAPYDFTATTKANGETRIEVKSTTAGFDHPMHLSGNQIRTAAESSVRFSLYRIYKLEDGEASIRIVDDLRPFAQDLLSHVNGLPSGVTVDSFTVNPSDLNFGPEQQISIDREDSELDAE